MREDVSDSGGEIGDIEWSAVKISEKLCLVGVVDLASEKEIELAATVDGSDALNAVLGIVRQKQRFAGILPHPDGFEVSLEC